MGRPKRPSHALGTRSLNRAFSSIQRMGLDLFARKRTDLVAQRCISCSGMSLPIPDAHQRLMSASDGLTPLPSANRTEGYVEIGSRPLDRRQCATRTITRQARRVGGRGAAGPSARDSP